MMDQLHVSNLFFWNPDPTCFLLFESSFFFSYLVYMQVDYLWEKLISSITHFIMSKSGNFQASYILRF